jgi:hypothetical protein
MHARVHGQPGSNPGLDFPKKLSDSRTLSSPRLLAAKRGPLVRVGRRRGQVDTCRKNAPWYVWAAREDKR